MEIWLDGVPLGGGVAEAAAGRHLLQIRRSADGPLQGLVLHVEDAVRVVDPADLGMAGPLPLEFLPTALETVAGLLRTRGVGGDDTFVVHVGDEPGVWFWDPGEGRLDPLSRALAMGGRRPSGGGPPPRALAPVLLGIGAGWNAEEMEDHGTAFKDRWKVTRERVLAYTQDKIIAQILESAKAVAA